MQGISIHAPLTGSDPVTVDDLAAHMDFNPRSPYGERLNATPLAKSPINFNPRSPYGERHRKRVDYLYDVLFQSTLPLRGATTSLPLRPGFPGFQSTLPLRGATLLAEYIMRAAGFQSTLPLRGATMDEEA